MARSAEWPDLEWRPPRSFSPGRPGGPPRFVVVHYTAGSEGAHAAEAGADYDGRRSDGTSAHYYVDSDSVVQCVRTTDRSHTALYHGNLWGIHYELTGTRQSRAQWLDPVSRATIRNAARQMARDMKRWGIPIVKTSDVRNLSARGITGHVDWTLGWPEDGGDHADPGPEFPYDVLMADIAGFFGGAVNREGDDVLFIGRVAGGPEHVGDGSWRRPLAYFGAGIAKAMKDRAIDFGQIPTLDMLGRDPDAPGGTNAGPPAAAAVTVGFTAADVARELIDQLRR